MKSIAAVTGSVFTYCIFLNTPEADAFSQVALPVGVSSAAMSKTSLAAAHDCESCSCSMCSVGRQLSTPGAHSSGCPCEACSQAARATHGNGCPCNNCSQAARSAHGDGCPCSSCAKVAGSKCGPSCNCPSCLL